MTERSIFLAALEKEGAERAAYLDTACADNAEMRGQVEALLQEHAGAGSFLEGRAFEQVTLDSPGAVLEQPGSVIGPYKLLEQIGEGGFGFVFMAEQSRPIRRKVALKVLKPGMDSRQVVARFEAERQALALMDHPNIAHVIDGGETAGGRPFFVMELVRGVPITDFCDQSHLPVRERLELFVTVCQAVQHAHTKGIIHRDLKPSNVMVTLHDGVPVAKVIDFGIAKALGQQLTDKTLFTNYAIMIGTPIYMSPEQAEMSGLDVDTRTDVYALGVLAYELLTGTTPCDKERLRSAGYDELRRIIREEEPAKPSTKISTLGQAAATVSANRKSDPKKLRQLFRGELDWIVLKALEKDRKRRYESASAFGADVQRYLDDEPVQACPPSAAYRLRKFARRNTGLLTATTLVILVLLAGTVVSTWQMIRATHAETLAERRLAREQELRTLAQGTAGDANARLWDSLRLQARARRASRSVGQRFDSLEALGKAMTLDIPKGRSRDELRNEAIACLALPDLRVVQEWDSWPAGSFNFAFDAALERCARSDRQGQIHIRRIADPKEQFSVRGGDVVELSPNGEFLAAWGEFSGQVQVWRVGEPKPHIVVSGAARGIPCGFSPDSRRLALVLANGAIDLYELATGQLHRLASGPPSHRPAFSPKGDRLALSSGRAVEIRDAATGELLAELPQSGGNQSFAWHPDGHKIAAADYQRRLAVWDVASRTVDWSAEASRNHGVVIAYCADGNLLLSNCWNSTLRLWHAETGQQLLRVPAWPWTLTGLHIARDGRRFVRYDAGKLSIWDVNLGREYRTLVRDPTHGTADYYDPKVSSDGRLLAAPVESGVVLWDLETSREIGFLPTGPLTRWVHFTPDGALLIESAIGVVRWPLARDSATPACIQIGPPQRLPYRARIGLSRDGRILVEPYGPTIHDRDRPDHVVALGPRSDPRAVAISPDGRWVATKHLLSEAKGFSGIRIWNAQSGERIAELALEEPGEFAFCPENRWLATVSRSGCQLWRTADWSPGPLLEGSTFVFAPDGESIAVQRSPGTVVLWQCDPRRELARLEAPDSDRAGGLTYTPDGTRLIYTTADTLPSLRMWDLPAISEQLKKLGLGWETPPYKPSAVTAQPVVPLTVEINEGEMKALRLNNDAWRLATGPASQRNPAKALELSREAVKLEPANSLYLNTLGVAQYRNQLFKEAILTLEQSLAHSKGQWDAFDLYFLAMCHARLGEPIKAQDCFDRALKWVEQQKNLPAQYAEELRRFRAEASALLGVEKVKD
jgi:serine/threonine protein kinase/WD40 repeat protein